MLKLTLKHLKKFPDLTKNEKRKAKHFQRKTC